jgi:hypothetical protein
LDVLYITAQKGESNAADDYMRLLRECEESVVVIDEYSWIDGRDKLDAFHFTLGNVDRHTHNCGIIVDSSGKVFRFPPLFDNGRSLNTDRADGSSCTLSGSFTKLVTVFGYPIRPAFTFNKEKAIGALSTFEGV